ncbi:hypothetical protein QA612_12750 [Evansella sp. AB-P1]|uniref:radical SAM protein n=1 Tax=Evansella sp. AB-P1 TaxID=3037653 RepID=UPI00241DCF95|nr:radical SAM protein [Evansella sp. AB-P1]MDG5788352.1 hypothetical protein [Evansella sp. AB-P1]
MEINETIVKGHILSKGVVFTNKAVNYAIESNAKGQNLVYNAPKNYENGRPQELFIRGLDGYEVVASCVAPNVKEQAVVIDHNGEKLVAIIDNNIIENISLEYVPEPSYYSMKTSKGTPLKRLVSACGLDELNIWPWHDCAISNKCKFCGVNTILHESDSDDLFTSLSISRKPEKWDQFRDYYLEDLTEAVKMAMDDPCYDEHLHLILISGNLTNDQLDLQANIFSDIANTLQKAVGDKATEGVVSVMMPPKDPALLQKMKDSGVDIVVFNLEVAQNPYFEEICPGKAKIGRDFIIERLEQSVEIFGRDKVWCNFVFGLEPIDGLLEMCEYLASKGITPGANILHLDQGSVLKNTPPTVEEIIYFYSKLADLYKKYDLNPYYCQKALRTGLANEAFAGRLAAATVGNQGR